MAITAVAEKEEDNQEVYISIVESVPTVEGLPDLLRHIADKIEEGNTSGYYPTWEIVEKKKK